MVVYATTIAATVILGFLGGFLTFKRSLRWCRHCGQTLSCADCAGRPTPITAGHRAAERR